MLARICQKRVSTEKTVRRIFVVLHIALIIRLLPPNLDVERVCLERM